MLPGRYAYRRHLPHYQTAFRTYFVTFVTRDRAVLPNAARDIVLRHVVECALCYLHVAVVMPDHVHLIAAPHWQRDGLAVPLCGMLRRIKGASAREVNLTLGRTGSLWQSESFDHEIRRDESLVQKIEYVRQNP